MCKVAHLGGRLTAKTNSEKNADIDALLVPIDDMREAGNRGARTLILSIRSMREAEVNERQIASYVLLDECAVFKQRWILVA